MAFPTLTTSNYVWKLCYRQWQFFLIFGSIMGVISIRIMVRNRNFLTQNPCNFQKSQLSAPLYSQKKHGSDTLVESKKRLDE